MLPEESIFNDKASRDSNLAPDLDSPLIPDSNPAPDFKPAAVTEAEVAGEQFTGTALNPIRPRTSQAMAAEQNQAALAALNAPATMDDLYRVWRQAAGMKPEEALTRLRQTARRLPDDSRQMLPDIVQGGDAREVWAFLQTHPDTEDLLMRPEFQKIFGGKFKKIGTIETIWNSLPVGAAWQGAKRGWMNLDFGREAFYNLGDFSDPKVRARLMAMEAERGELLDYLERLDERTPFFVDWLRSFFVNAGDTAGGMVGAGLTPEALASTAAGAGLGAAVGGLGAGPGALGGLLTGAAVAQGEAVTGQTAWDVYQAQAEELKDERLAITYGLAAGIPSVLLERVGLGGLVMGAGPIMRGAVSRAAQRIAPEAAARVGRVVASKTAEGVTARFALNALAHTAPEVVTEGLQEGWEMQSQRLAAKNYNLLYGSRGVSAPVPTMGDVFQAAMAGAWQAAWGGAGVGLIAPGVAALRDAESVSAYLADMAQGNEDLKNMSPEQQEAVVAKAGEAAGKQLHLNMVERANDDLRKKAKTITETLRQDPDMKQAPEALQELLSGGEEKTAFANAQTLQTFFQSAQERTGLDEDSLSAELLEPLGVSPEQYYEALDNNTDLQLDLTGLPFVVDNPIWDQVAEALTVEPLAVTEDLRADLEAMGPPPAILTSATANVDEKVRGDLEKQLLAAGRSKTQARGEAEAWSRMAGVLSRASGRDVNDVLGGMVSFVRGDGRPVDAEGRRLEQPAYHGSPHRFDRFSLEHMGTGEGAQAYGWGLYFAGSRQISEWYRKRLSSQNAKYLTSDGNQIYFEPSSQQWVSVDALGERITLDGFDGYALASSYLGIFDGDYEKAIADAKLDLEGEEELLSLDPDNFDINAVVGLRTAIEILEKKSISYQRAEGQLYKVDIPDDGYLLNWDATLDKQPALVKKIITQLDEDFGFDFIDAKTGKDIYRGIEMRIAVDNMAMEYQHGPSEAASTLLNTLGIKGIRYLDATSRDAGEGTHNYVIFDDSTIEILKTYYQSASGQGPRGWTEILSDESYRVVFSPNADASTAMHEFQHIFIDQALKMRDLAPEQIADPGAYKQLMADLDTLEAWAGVTDGQWTVEAHERVAEGFEAYLMEGKAPVKELRGVFSRMKKWLLEIYEGLKAIQAPLSDDVRRVFDRQLATEEEMLADQLMREPAFDLSEMGEVDPALLAEYEEALRKAALADEEEAVNFRNAERERLIRQWRKEGREEAKADPRQVRLAEIVKAGGIARASLEAGGYDATAINQIMRRRPGLVSLKLNQTGFDEWGERYGFESGDDFIQSIINSPTIDELTDSYVAEREAEFAEYFDSPALITDARLDAWELELKLWGRFMGEEGSKYQNADWKDIRRIIETKTGLKTMDEIAAQDMRDLKAQLKARQREAEAIFKAGAREAGREIRAEERARAKALVMEEKLRLGVHYKIMAERRRDFERTTAHWAQLVKQKLAPMYKAEGVRPDFQSQIVNLLNAAGFTARTLPSEKSLADFVAKLHADGAPVAVADWIQKGQWPEWQNGMRAGRRKTYRSLSYDEFLDLKFAIQNLEHLGRRQQQVSVDGRLVDEDKAAQELIDSILQFHQIREPKSHGERLEEGGRRHSLFSGIIRAGQDYMSSIIKVETMARVLDGHQIDGPAQKLIYKAINQAYEKGMALTEDLIRTRLKAVVDSTIGEKGMLKWRSEKIAVPGLPWALTTEQRVMYALNTGNRQNLKALRNYLLGPDNTPTTDAQHQAILDSLTKEQWDFVQSVWDFMDNEMFPHMDALTLRTKGIPLRKVEAMPVDTKYGVMRGGYFPLKFDAAMSERADRYRDSAQALAANPTLYGKPDTQASATIERKGTTYANLVPMLNFQVMANSLNSNIHDLTHREAVNDVWRIIRRPEVRQAIEGVLGDNYWIQTKRWLQEVGDPEPVGDPGGRNLLRKIRGNTSVAAMALKFSVMLCQVTGITQSVHKIGTLWTTVGITSIYKNPLAIPEMVRQIYGKSSYMKSRQKGDYDRDVHDTLAMGNPLAKTLKDKWVEKAFWPIAMLDQAVALPIWQGAYLKATKEGRSEADAVYFADSIVRVTQPTGVTKDMSRAQRGWGYGDAGKLLTMFSTFFSGTQNLIWEQYHETKSHFEKGQYLTGSMKAGRAGMLMVVLPALLEFLIKEGPPEDEEDLADIGKSVVSYTVGGMPGVKDVVSRLIGDSYRFRPAPVLDSIEAAIGIPGAVADIVTGEEGGWNRLVRGAGPLTGIPSGQISATMKGLEDWSDNEGWEAFYRLLVRGNPK